MLLDFLSIGVNKRMFCLHRNGVCGTGRAEGSKRLIRIYFCRVFVVLFVLIPPWFLGCDSARDSAREREWVLREAMDKTYKLLGEPLPDTDFMVGPTYELRIRTVPDRRTALPRGYQIVVVYRGGGVEEVVATVRRLTDIMRGGLLPGRVRIDTPEKALGYVRLATRVDTMYAELEDWLGFEISPNGEVGDNHGKISPDLLKKVGWHHPKVIRSGEQEWSVTRFVAEVNPDTNFNFDRITEITECVSINGYYEVSEKVVKYRGPLKIRGIGRI